MQGQQYPSFITALLTLLCDVKNIKLIYYLFVFSAILLTSSCSGGNDGGSLSPTDNNPSIVSSTTLNANQLALKKSFIKIKFNEEIQLPTKENVDIFRFDAASGRMNPSAQFLRISNLPYK